MHPVLLLLATPPVLQSPAAADLLLADNKRSTYSIVLAADAAPATKHAAEELARFLEQITGAHLALVTDQTSPVRHEILVGPSRRLEHLSLKHGDLGDEGYLLRTVGERLVITGATPRGTLYGVYGLLEEHLGCRWF